MDLLKKGQPYDKLNPTYIIFICNFDLFGKGLYSYTFQKHCQEDASLILPDDTTVLFLNATGTHGTVTPHTKSFLQYVHEHIVTDAFTDEINTEILKINVTKKYEVSLCISNCYYTIQKKKDGKKNESY